MYPLKRVLRTLGETALMMVVVGLSIVVGLNLAHWVVKQFGIWWATFIGLWFLVIVVLAYAHDRW